MSNPLVFPTLAALTAHAVEAYKSYAGPWPSYAKTEQRRAEIFAERCAFGRTGMTRYELADGEDYARYVAPMGNMLAWALDVQPSERLDFRVIEHYILAALTQK